MATLTVHVSKLAVSTALADPVGTTIDATKTMVVSGPRLRKMVVRVKVTNVAGGNVQLKAGVNPPALSAANGDLVTAFAQNDVKWFGPFDGDLYSQVDGSVHFTVDSAVTGTIEAFHFPRP